MMRKEAEDTLRDLFGMERFYDLQWEVIRPLMEGRRILLIARTGFGKSLCYQFPATQFDHTTVVFSPLIALMRDQVTALRERGIEAACLNSDQESEENDRILAEAREGKLDILYVAPERQTNLEWMEAVMTKGAVKISMIVIDEAHCISTWGHDFRPAYRRIVNLVKILPSRIPLLATTATATERVARDIEKQIAGDLEIFRDKLMRPNLHLKVVKVEGKGEKKAWLAEHLSQMKGTGIIYSGTRKETEEFSAWLQYQDISAVHYHAGLEGEVRRQIEEGFMENRWKAVVSTNALGMGVDKPDIRFIIHTQFPGSPIFYYQEMGRGGRDGKATDIVLLYDPADRKLQEFFIDNSRPPRHRYEEVIELLRQEPLTSYELRRKGDLYRGEVRTILSDLEDQGIAVKRREKKKNLYEYKYGAPALDTTVFEESRRRKKRELNKIIEYCETDRCRMNFLCHYLGDEAQVECGHCDNESSFQEPYRPQRETEKEILEFNRTFFPELSISHRRFQILDGLALAYFTDRQLKKESTHFLASPSEDHSLIKRSLQACRRLSKEESNWDLVAYIPSQSYPRLIKTWASILASALDLPLFSRLVRREKTPRQRNFRTRLRKRKNVKDTLVAEGEESLEGKKILLLDDYCHTGETLREGARALKKRGAVEMTPLTLAKVEAGDL